MTSLLDFMGLTISPGVRTNHLLPKVSFGDPRGPGQLRPRPCRPMGCGSRRERRCHAETTSFLMESQRAGNTASSLCSSWQLAEEKGCNVVPLGQYFYGCRKHLVVLQFSNDLERYLLEGLGIN